MFLHHYFHRLGAVVSSRQGAKPACGSASFDGVAVKSAFALLLSKVTKDIPPQPSPVGLALAGISVPGKKKIGKVMRMERTISMMIGPGSINHNNRKFVADNVDRNRVKDNVVLVNQNLKKVYHELFDEALKKYNEKQKRKDRKIKDYYEHVRQDKQLKQFYEVIVQVGNKDDMACGTKEGNLAKYMLQDYIEDFQARNPNLKVFNAVIHMDEATPHLHINFVPFSQGNTRGLETQVSLKGALKAHGITGSGRRDTEWTRWIEKEKEAFSISMARYGVEWNHLDTRKEHLSVLEYKKQERTKEVQQLDEEKERLQEDVEQIKEDIRDGEREAENAWVEASEARKEIDDIRQELACTKEELQEVRADVRNERQKGVEEKEKLVAERRELREEKDSLEREKRKLQLEVDRIYVEKRNYLEQYEKRIAELTDKDKELCEDITDKESTISVLDALLEETTEKISIKEALVKKAEQRLSSINELLNKYRDPFDQKEKMIALQLKVNDLEEENATLKHKLQQAYEFMKSKFLNRVNLFEEFARSIGAKVQEQWEDRNKGAR